MSVVKEFADLVRAGFRTVGSAIPVEVDGSTVAVRDLLVEIGDAITCFSVEDGTVRVVFSMPAEAKASAASAVVVRILSGVVAREIETLAEARVDAGRGSPQDWSRNESLAERA